MPRGQRHPLPRAREESEASHLAREKLLAFSACGRADRLCTGFPESNRAYAGGSLPYRLKMPLPCKVMQRPADDLGEGAIVFAVKTDPIRCINGGDNAKGDCEPTHAHRLPPTGAECANSRLLLKGSSYIALWVAR